MDMKTYSTEIQAAITEYEAAKTKAWNQALEAFARGECSHPATENHSYYDDLLAPAKVKYFAARNAAYLALAR